MLNDFLYKNEVQAYWNTGINNQLRWAIVYRQRAIHCYKEIAKLLGKSADHESFTVNQEASDLLVGQWEVVGRSERVFTILQKEKRLYIEISEDEKRELFYLGRDKMVDSQTNYATIVREDSELLLKYNVDSLIKIE